MKLDLILSLFAFALIACNTAENEIINESSSSTQTVVQEDVNLSDNQLSAFLRVDSIGLDHYRIVFVDNDYEQTIDEVIAGYAEQISPSDFVKLGLPDGTVSAILLERTHHGATEYFSLIENNGAQSLIRAGYFGEIDWQEIPVNLQLLGLWSSDTQKVSYLQFTASQLFTSGLDAGDNYWMDENKIYCSSFGDKYYTINSLTEDNLNITDPFGDTWNMYKSNPFD
jgi:hypothetical protein